MQTVQGLDGKVLLEKLLRHRLGNLVRPRIERLNSFHVGQTVKHGNSSLLQLILREVTTNLLFHFMDNLLHVRLLDIYTGQGGCSQDVEIQLGWLWLLFCLLSSKGTGFGRCLGLAGLFAWGTRWGRCIFSSIFST